MHSHQEADHNLRNVTGTIFDIDQTASHDGPGLRMTVYMKGCSLRCRWCHSPESIAPLPQIAWLPTRCTGCGTCARVCPQGFDPAQVPADERPTNCLDCLVCVQRCPNRALVVKGEQTTAGAIADEAARLLPFFRRTGGGVTLTGGEPLMQPDFACAIATLCRAAGIHVAVETCGFGNWDDLARLASVVDIFLFDVKLLDEQRHREYTGQSNQPIIDNLRRLTTVDAEIVVRVPLIPAHTDGIEDIQALGELVRELGLGSICLLPYNPAAPGKYAWLRQEYPLADTERQTAPYLQELAQLLHGFGLTVTVEG